MERPRRGGNAITPTTGEYEEDGGGGEGDTGDYHPILPPPFTTPFYQPLLTPSHTFILV